MSAAIVSRRLAEGLVNHLAERLAEVNGAVESWRSAEVEAGGAREREADALDAAHAAQLSRGADAGDLTQHAVEAQAAAELAAHVARRARATLANVVVDAEIAAARARAKVARMAPEDAALVEQAVQVTQDRAREARSEAGLGPSAEEHARQRSAAWVAAQRAAAVPAPESPNGATPATAVPTKGTRAGPRLDRDDDEAPSTAFPKVDWRTLSAQEKVDRVQHALAIITAAQNDSRDPPSWRELERQTGISVRKLRAIKKLVEEYTEAERSAAQRREQSLHRHAARKHLAV